jgi:hypothetical protein
LIFQSFNNTLLPKYLGLGGFILPKKPNPPPDDGEQAKRFIKTARKLQENDARQEFLKVMNTVLPVKSEIEPHRKNK